MDDQPGTSDDNNQQQDKIESQDEDSSEEFNIARRTRSHVRIDDFVLNDNLDFPDVDKNLYQNPDSVSDPEYKNFLYQCYSTAVEQCNDTTSEDNDPAYVYNDDIFSHGWKFNLDEELFQQQQQQQDEEEEGDGDLEESSKRLNELIGAQQPTTSYELALAQDVAKPDCVVVDANYDPCNTDLISSFSDQKSAVASLSSVPGFKSPHKPGFPKRRIDFFDNPEFQRVLNQQLRQHVQLLTQAYLVASCMTNMHSEAAEAKSHLNSYLKIFRNRRKPSNLLPAIKLVNDCVAPKELKSSVRLSWRHLPVPDMAKKIIKQQPNVFPYVDLLPQVAFSVLPEKLVTKKKISKIIFTPNEDKLLAIALKEFENEYSQYAYIASLLMAAKTKMQINNHVKNMKRSETNNPIRLFVSQGQLPHVDLDSDSRLRDLATERISIQDDIEIPKPSIVRKSESGVDSPLVQEQQQQHQHQDQNNELKKSEKIEEQPTQHFSHLRQHVAESQKTDVVHPNEEEEQVEYNRQFQTETAHPVEDVSDVRQPTQPYKSKQPTSPVPPENPTSQAEHLEERPNHSPGLSRSPTPPGRPRNSSSPLQHHSSPEPTVHDPSLYHNQDDDMMNMDLDDLMAASTTISKNNPFSGANHHHCNTNGIHNHATSISDKNIRNQKLRKSMLDLMSHKFSLSQEMGNLMVRDFLKMSQEKLDERDNMHLLQLMTELMCKEVNGHKPNGSGKAFNEISRFLKKLNAPNELQERLILFLDLDQATKCGCALEYLHWMRFFQFIQHVELYHDSDALEKKLIRLIDAIQKDDPHKIRLASANLINKHPLLKSEFDALSLDGKPHPSLFANEEDFDDITEPFTVYDNYQVAIKTEKINGQQPFLDHNFEHFEHKLTQDEINFASQSCPCNCHNDTSTESSNNNTTSGHQQQQLGQHCNKCNLKFMKGRMYLVNKIKPFLAEWTYVDRQQTESSESSFTSPASISKSFTVAVVADVAPSHSSPPLLPPPPPAPTPVEVISNEPQPEVAELSWTFEEDKEILEFCRAKAELNDENVSFDTTTFEELVKKRRRCGGSSTSAKKKGAKEIAERFNHLMEMYRRDDSAPSALTGM